LRTYADRVPAWIHIVIPALMTTSGVAIGATALLADDAPPSSAVWIDSPGPDGTVAPGEVTVVAHASAEASITDLKLFVDGEEVASDESLVRFGRLVYADMKWQASEGDHELIVRQGGGSGTASAARNVTVSDSVPTPDPVPSESPTPTPTEETPTPTPTQETIDPDLDGGVVDTPLIGAVGFSSAPRVSVRASCGNSVIVYATIENTDEATVKITGVGSYPMSTARGTRWSAQIDSGFEMEDIGNHRVSILVPAGGSMIEKRVGSLSIEEGCID